LPLLENNDEYKAGALFNFSIASPRLRNRADAGTFFEHCATFNGLQPAVCTHNRTQIQSTYRIVQ
jgi:hypothetical protein